MIRDSQYFIDRHNLIYNDTSTYGVGNSERDDFFSKSLSGNGDSNKIYSQSEIVKGLTYRVMTIKDLESMNDLVEAFDNMISTAALNVSPYNDSYLSWPSNGSQESIQEIKLYKEYCMLLWVLKNSPNFIKTVNTRTSETYEDFYNRALSFIETHIWEKWYVRSIGQLWNNSVDKDGRPATMALFLYEITEDDTKKAQYLRKIEEHTYKGNTQGALTGGNILAHFEVNIADSEAWQWDRHFDGSIPGGIPQNGLTAVNDHAHATNVPFFAIWENFFHGYFTLEDIQRFSKTFRVFATDFNLGTCVTFLDGTNVDGSPGDLRDRPHYNGFSDLGRFDVQLQEDMENHPLTYFYQNRDATNWNSTMAFNRAYQENAIQLPENYRKLQKVLEHSNSADTSLYVNEVTAKTVVYTGEYGLVRAFAASGNGADIYPLDAAWALPELFQATGKRKYLNDALDLYYTLFQSASPSNTLPQSPQGYNDTYLSWYADSGATNLSGYLSGGVGQSVLQESRGLMHLAKILWIMDNSPVLMTETNSKTNRTYQSEFDYLLNNLQVNFWDKWISRRGASAYTFGGVDQTAAWDYIAVHLFQITGLQRYKDLNDRVYFNIDRSNTQPPENQSEASQIGFEELIVPNNANPNAVQWCGDWACREYLYSGQLETIQDYIHAGRVVKNFIANIELGMPHYTTSLIPKLINTVPVFWPESFANSREIYYWMDGRHWAEPEGREEYHAMTEGWYTMGRWDADLRNRFETVNQQILDYYVENRQLSMHHGANAFNTAYADRVLQYPEQNLNYLNIFSFIKKIKANQALIMAQ